MSDFRFLEIGTWLDFENKNAGYDYVMTGPTYFMELFSGDDTYYKSIVDIEKVTGTVYKIWRFKGEGEKFGIIRELVLRPSTITM